MQFSNRRTLDDSGPSAPLAALNPHLRLRGWGMVGVHSFNA
ncbi:hypothetical protein [Rubidibacter lacunae]|nr:hypothetical protein [Rubidibacter lacunae]